MESRLEFRQSRILDLRRIFKDAVPATADLSAFLEHSKPISRCFCFGKFGCPPIHLPVRRPRRIAPDQPICPICSKVKAMRLQVIPVASQETNQKQCLCEHGRVSPRYSAPLSVTYFKKKERAGHVRGKSEVEFTKQMSDKAFPACTPEMAMLRLTPLSRLQYPSVARSSLLDVKRLGNKSNKTAVMDTTEMTQDVSVSLNMSLPLPQLLEPLPGHIYVLYPGNNSHLLRRLFKRRKHWSEGKPSSPSIQFSWHPTSHTVRFDRLVPYQSLQIVNHFEYHWELTNKLHLFRNCKFYCEQNQLNVMDFIPMTFSLDFESKRFHAQYNAFSCFFKSLAEGQKKGNKEKTACLPETHNSGRNIWLLKPSGYNRGIGICVFSTLEEFKSAVDEYHLSLRSQSKPSPVRTHSNKPRSSRFVIQKYIEKPFLLHERKFDIRIWAVLTQESQGYMYREGYLRTSSEAFTLDETLLGSQYVHLTNNAVQKHGPMYGRFERGNQVSFEEFQRYLEMEGRQVNVRTELIPQLRHQVRLSLSAVFPTQTLKKLNPLKRTYCFELFGYDFIVDEQLHPWLIEVNTNPCLELSSPLLEQLIPCMLDDLLRLTVDRVFPTEYSKELAVTQVVELAPGKNNWEHVGCLTN